MKTFTIYKIWASLPENAIYFLDRELAEKWIENNEGDFNLDDVLVYAADERHCAPEKAHHYEREQDCVKRGGTRRQRRPSKSGIIAERKGDKK